MKVNGNTIKPGNVIEHKDALWVATKTSHVKPGKGGAFAQIELRNLKDGTKLNERFRSSESIEKVILEETPHIFLYKENENLIFMNNDTFEQISIDFDMIGEQSAFLQDGMNVVVESHESKPIGIRLPDQVTLEVSETEAVVKGQTAASSNKPAICDNGVRVMVPPFIEIGDNIIVDTNEVTYLKRAD